MKIHINHRQHLEAFIQLNEQWITEHFAIEQSDQRGQGLGRALMGHAIAHARVMGFRITSRCQHPVYSRCNVTMALDLAA
jgi:predicted GNAT family acetyltransferase